MSASRQVRVYKILGWSLRVLSVLLVVVDGIYALETLPTFPTPYQASNLWPLIQVFSLLLIGAAVVIWLSGHMFKLGNELDKSIYERLHGYVVTTDAATFDQLAGWTRISRKETGDRLAKIASQGGLKDYAVDVSNRTVYRAERPPPPSVVPPTPSSTPPYNQTPPPNQLIAEPDEVIKVKAKLYELDVLRQQGKIGQPAYEKLKEEYEKRLAQADKGTQVY